VVPSHASFEPNPSFWPSGNSILSPSSQSPSQASGVTTCNILFWFECGCDFVYHSVHNSGCGRSVGIVRLRTKTTAFSFLVFIIQVLDSCWLDISGTWEPVMQLNHGTISFLRISVVCTELCCECCCVMLLDTVHSTVFVHVCEVCESCVVHLPCSLACIHTSCPSGEHVHTTNKNQRWYSVNLLYWLNKQSATFSCVSLNH
jgi:hypothetical protein